MKRAIHVIPDLSLIPEVEAFRQRFDSLYKHIAAHITLVFPFDFPVSDDVVMNHCRSSSIGIEPFSVKLGSPFHSRDNHLWLPVLDSALLLELTKRLYSGPLAPLAGTRRNDDFHITIARPPLPPPDECDKFKSQLIFPVAIDVDSIILESIQPDDTSLALGRFPLQI